ncbi:hypothetical protein WJX72_006838 [[Myrmecia] bisecta]|uniref:Uncharacterized protein n=1 Tax=[Myrmecia] bisecta TaxID=41462 RepID=A0AAW1QR75_9CHLO
MRMRCSCREFDMSIRSKRFKLQTVPGGLTRWRLRSSWESELFRPHYVQAAPAYSGRNFKDTASLPAYKCVVLHPCYPSCLHLEVEEGPRWREGMSWECSRDFNRQVVPRQRPHTWTLQQLVANNVIRDQKVKLRFVALGDVTEKLSARSAKEAAAKEAASS